MSITSNTIIPERITKLREALGWSQADLAKRVGATQQSIGMIEAGKVKRPTKLHEIAKALNADVDYLIGANDVKPVDGLRGPVAISTQGVSYGGRVGAGGFLPVNEYFDQDDDSIVVPSTVTRHPAFPTVAQNAWLVDGDSMDQAGIYDGMWIVAAKYLDYVDKVGELRNGQFVIVERNRHGGSERELTVKEVQFARGGMRLLPRSSNPKHRAFFIPLDTDADPDTEVVMVVGVVLAATRDFAALAYDH